MVEKHSISCPHGTEIITDCGLIRQIQTGLQMRTTEAQVFQPTAAKTGPVNKTSPPRSFTTSLGTMHFPTTFTARNRQTRMSAWPAEAIPASSDPKIASAL